MKNEFISEIELREKMKIHAILTVIVRKQFVKLNLKNDYSKN